MQVYSFYSTVVLILAFVVSCQADIPFCAPGKEFHIFLDVSKSVSGRTKKLMGTLFDEILGEWFNTDGSTKLTDFKIALYTFSIDVQNYLPPSSNLTLIKGKFEEMQNQKQYGTHTHSVFEYLTSQKDNLIAQNSCDSDGLGLNVLVITDGTPYLSWGFRKIRNELFDRGIDIPQTGFNRVTTGILMLEHILQNFTAEFPATNLYGASPKQIGSTSTDIYFNMFYMPDDYASVPDFANDVLENTCSNDPTYAPTRNPTSSPTTKVPTVSPTANPTAFELVEVTKAPTTPLVCHQQDFRLYLDISVSMTAKLKEKIYSLFVSLLNTWFKSNGQFKPNIDLQMEINTFANKVGIFTQLGTKTASNGNLLKRYFKKAQRKRARGTHTFLIFKELVEDFDTITASDTVATNGTGLHVIIATDGDPYLYGSTKQKAKYFTDAGIPFVNGNAVEQAYALHNHYFQLFKATYPYSQVFGFAPFKLDDTFVDNTFDVFYYPQSGFTIEEWSDTVTRNACE